MAHPLSGAETGARVRAFRDDTRAVRPAADAPGRRACRWGDVAPVAVGAKP